MANNVSRETVSGKRHAVAEAEPTDRIKRESTEEATTLASQKKGRNGQAGTKKQVIQGSHMVSSTRSPALLLFQDSGMRAGQQPQRADVL